MQIFPLIELQNGRCVSLTRGRLDEPHIWHVDPVQRARDFAAAGAEWIHVTDFDWVAHDHGSDQIVLDIIRRSGASVQLGGGFRTMEAIETWIEHGAGRIVVSSIATQNPDLVKQAANRFPDQIALAVDVWQGHVMAGGWKTSTAFTPVEFLSQFNDAPLASVIVTDIDADIEDSDATLALTTQMAEIANAPVIARGNVRSLDDISRLKYVPKVAGAMLGRALFSRDIDLNEALAVASIAPEPRAEMI